MLPMPLTRQHAPARKTMILAAAALTLFALASADDDVTRLRRSAYSTPLGKRITSTLVAELGKRPKDLYSFGIGKRSISNAEMEEYLSETNNKAGQHGQVGPVSGSGPLKLHKAESSLVDEEDHDFSNDKRDPYAFGLGKRSGEPAYAFGMGKRDPYAFGLGKRDPYAFGLGKREDPYAFGLGKRDPYAFGLGKRDPYAFGLGKRDPYAFGLGKRDPYAFGLGKRSGEPTYAFGMGKRDPYAFGLGKRSGENAYAFGMGKRDPYAFGLGKRDPYAFGLGKRDPYAFGLGKRDPYSFGLGK